MARFKIKRIFLTIDMTAMCDVAFMLLCFFILVGRNKADYEKRVQIPSISSYPICSLWDGNAVEIIIGSGKCYINIDGVMRAATLKNMGKRYGISFTAAELEKFAKMQSFGIPINGMKDYINNYSFGFATIDRSTGIPFNNTVNNELTNWISACKQVNHEIGISELRIAIVGDEKEKYGTVKIVINNLQQQRINKFSLVNRAANITQYPQFN